MAALEGYPPPHPAWEAVVTQRMLAIHRNHARDHGLPLDEYHRDAHERLLELLDSPEVRVRVRLEHFGAILNDGRVKTQFETNLSSGFFNPDLRRAFEHLVLGVPLDVANDWRPVYGYLEGSNELFLSSVYGSVVLHLKPEVGARATFALGDSLDDTQHGTSFAFVPQPLRTPTVLAAQTHVDLLGFHALGSTFGNRYAEAQIYGQLWLNRDVAKITFTNGLAPGPRLADRLVERELQWEYVGGAEP